MQLLSCKIDTIFGYNWHRHTKHPFQLGKRPSAPLQADAHSVQMLTNSWGTNFSLDLTSPSVDLEKTFLQRWAAQAPRPSFHTSFCGNSSHVFQSRPADEQTLSSFFCRGTGPLCHIHNPSQNFSTAPQQTNQQILLLLRQETPLPREKCPAQGQTCNYCHKLFKCLPTGCQGSAIL